MTVLVTGGAGYIGSHTCLELLENGFDIVVIDNFSNSHPSALDRVWDITGKSFPIYKADMGNKDVLRAIFKENKIHTVIHLAGSKAVGESNLRPLKYYLNNLVVSVHLCEIMQEFNVKQLVFSSSATVYKEGATMPLDETAPLNAINPYGRTKQMAEKFLEDLYMADPEWGIAILRYFNPIGAHASGHIGEDPKGIPNNLLPYIGQVAVGKRDYLSIFGNDYPTRDGTGIRDYIHVVDLAIGHVKALVKVEEVCGVDIFNLGTGIGYSVFEVVDAFSQVAKVDIPYRVVERRKGDAAVCYADPGKAERELLWQAKKGIKEMCMDTWRWQSQNPEGYKKAGLVTPKMKDVII